MSKQIRTLTKTQLCYIFDLCNATGSRCYYSRLRIDFFNDKALSEMGISLEDYERATRGRPFSYMQTRKIVDYFKISREELDAVMGFKPASQSAI